MNALTLAGIAEVNPSAEFLVAVPGNGLTESGDLSARSLQVAEAAADIAYVLHERAVHFVFSGAEGFYAKSDGDETQPDDDGRGGEALQMVAHATSRADGALDHADISVYPKAFNTLDNARDFYHGFGRFEERTGRRVPNVLLVGHHYRQPRLLWAADLYDPSHAYIPYEVPLVGYSWSQRIGMAAIQTGIHLGERAYFLGVGRGNRRALTHFQMDIEEGVEAALQHPVIGPKLIGGYFSRDKDEPVPATGAVI